MYFFIINYYLFLFIFIMIFLNIECFILIIINIKKYITKLKFFITIYITILYIAF